MDPPNPTPLPTADRPTIEPFLDECIHTARSLSQADVYALKHPWCGLLLKDFAGRPLWIRVLFLRRVVRREVRALRSLHGIPGIGGVNGRVDADAFLMERLDAGSLADREAAAQATGFFEGLNALVGRMHQRGWAHGDLRRKNILVGADERPYLIDFATAMHAGPGAGPLRRWLFQKWVRVDRTALARIKASYIPDALTSEEREILTTQPAFLRAGRWLRKRVYRPLKPRHRRETWNRIKGWFGLGSR